MSATTETTNAETDASDDISEEDIYELLSNRRRRFLIHAIKRADDPLDVSELSRYITAWELDMEPAEVPYDERHNVHSTLRRTHLPKLEEKNVVTVGEDGVVRPAPALRELDIYVEVLRGREIPWNLYYLGLSTFSVLLLIAVQIGVPGLGSLSPIAVGVFVATMFGISAAAHYVIGRRMVLGSTDEPPEVRRAG